MKKLLEVRDLKAGIGEKTILHGIDFSVSQGQIHVIMGPNGSGKSTFANILMGNPKFEVFSGKMLFDEHDLSSLTPEKRAALGMFMAFQYPREIAGVQFDRFMYIAYKNIMATRFPAEKPLTVFRFQKKLKEAFEHLGLSPDFAKRNLNEGFSGGEKKKAEMLQLAILEPRLAILDETDSGLDVDALKVVGEALRSFISQDKTRSALIVTHYRRILDFIKPDVVHVMLGGKIVKTGGADLAVELEEKGFSGMGEGAKL
ncbi:MAG: Fe-S cluster assembly ATPase SufC [Parcubacteria group bacterium]|nr:Fe-S cluster assembly ATPase SufC [Parcubacteria group bacterium]